MQFCESCSHSPTNSCSLSCSPNIFSSTRAIFSLRRCSSKLSYLPFSFSSESWVVSAVSSGFSGLVSSRLPFCWKASNGISWRKVYCV